jgi:hypothetical protein
MGVVEASSNMNKNQDLIASLNQLNPVRILLGVHSALPSSELSSDLLASELSVTMLMRY